MCVFFKDDVFFIEFLNFRKFICGIFFLLVEFRYVWNKIRKLCVGLSYPFLITQFAYKCMHFAIKKVHKFVHLVYIFYINFLFVNIKEDK